MLHYYAAKRGVARDGSFGDGLCIVVAFLLEKNPGAKIYMATTKSKQKYTDVNYEEDAYIMFGKESAGIPEEILLDYKETAVRIPMFPEIRSLNLANSVAIVLYEALRQQGFPELEAKGQLHHYEW